MSYCASRAALTDQANVAIGQTYNVTFPDYGPYSAVSISFLDNETSICVPYQSADIDNNTFNWTVEKKPSWWTLSDEMLKADNKVAFAAQNSSGWVSGTTQYTVTSSANRKTTKGAIAAACLLLSALFVTL